MRELLIIGAVLICPLVMLLMMRHGHEHGRPAKAKDPDAAPTEDLRRRWDHLDRLIGEREADGRDRIGRGASP